MSSRVSIKRRVLALVLTAVALVWVVTAGVVYFDARDEIDEVLDGHLAQAAALIMAQAAGEQWRDGAARVPALHRESRRVAFQVWQAGQLRLHSENAPGVRLSARLAGYSDASVRGEAWRVFSSTDAETGVMVQVGEREKTRRELARDVALNLLYPLVFALPVLAALLWLAIARGMRPLDAAAGAVAQRDPRNLSPLPDEAAPREVAPLIDALNRLFARIAASIAAEKRFTADAAHELRTPVAAIRAQAQVARGAAGDAERTRALDNVIAGCDRAAHLVDQLLMLARLDSAADGDKASCGLREAAAEAIADVAPYAVAKDVTLELLPGEELHVDGHAALLRVMLRNLIDNAARYSPPGTRVAVVVERAGGHANITVTDEGPGIAAADRERVFERFYRAMGTGAEGTGLGLSIVRRIADLHGAELHLGSPDGGHGLAVTAVFRIRGAA